MIARLWEGLVPAAQEAAYREFFFREVLPEYRSTSGNVDVTVLRRDEGEHVRFLVISRWSSREAIRAFAGEDEERAHYRPDALQFLIDPAPFATHYEVLLDADAAAG